MRDFVGLESPERICGLIPNQTRIRPYFWTESDSGVPSDSPPKLTGKKTLESLPKPLIFNIFSKKMGAGLILTPFTGAVNSGVIYSTLLRAGGNYLSPGVKSGNSTAMDGLSLRPCRTGSHRSSELVLGTRLHLRLRDQQESGALTVGPAGSQWTVGNAVRTTLPGTARTRRMPRAHKYAEERMQ